MKKKTIIEPTKISYFSNPLKPTSNQTFIFSLLLLNLINISNSTLQKPPPLPILPLPSASQLEWQSDSLSMFFHFGPNTFTDSEWGTGRADPSVFNPTRFNASQWVQVAKDAGFSKVILTAKHHDGFCLWPSEYTEYSVKSSPWREGKGDVVAELALAAKEAGVGLGLYLSPWDRHEDCYGKTLEYNEFYTGQMIELLTRYGEIKEVWLDGAKGEGAKDMKYFFDSWFSLIHQLQPGAVIFSDAGPDTRWIGDEAGVAGSTCWSLFNRSDAKIGGTDPLYSQEGDPWGHDWVPPECDVSIRPGWFWHPSQSPKSALELLDIYYKSVGRNCVFLLNVPPNTSGLIPYQDIQVLQHFKTILTSIFSNNLSENASITSTSTRGGHNSKFTPYNVLKEDIYTYWAPEEDRSDWSIQVDLHELVSFNVFEVREPIQMGQRVVRFKILIVDENEEWKEVKSGTTVGYRKLMRFPTVESRYLKFVVEKSRGDPLICYMGVYVDAFSVSSSHVFEKIQQNHNLVSEM